MTSESDAAGLVQAVAENAKRLGLTWDITMATIVDGSSPGSVTAVFDSDADSGAQTLGLISMIGQLAPGERIYVVTVPPAGNYIVGVVRSVSLGIVAMHNEAVNVSSTSGSGAAGPESTRHQMTSGRLWRNHGGAREGRLYKVSVYGNAFTGGGAFVVFDVYVRVVASGTLIGSYQDTYTPDNGHLTNNYPWFFYCYRDFGAGDLPGIELEISIQRNNSAAAGTITLESALIEVSDYADLSTDLKIAAAAIT